MATVPANPGRRRRRLMHVPVCRIGSGDLRAALAEGLDDFRSKRGDILFIGLLYPVIGLFAGALALGADLIPFFFPVAAGISLLGPVAAVGFYEIARRREEGLDAGWSHFLDVPSRPSWEAILVVAGLLLAIFVLWVATAGLLFTLFMGDMGVGSIELFAERLFTTPGGWALILIGNAAGFAFAWTVLSISVVSLPMLVDRDVGARAAIATSMRAVRKNKAVMARWGLTVAVLLVLGSIPLFIGLAFVLPWLGYSTWHLYTKLVDRDALPPEGSPPLP